MTSFSVIMSICALITIVPNYRYDGNVYEALYDAAQKSPMNQQDPFDGYQEYLRPRLDLEFLKVGNNKLPSHIIAASRMHHGAGPTAGAAAASASAPKAKL